MQTPDVPFPSSLRILPLYQEGVICVYRTLRVNVFQVNLPTLNNETKQN